VSGLKTVCARRREDEEDRRKREELLEAAESPPSPFALETLAEAGTRFDSRLQRAQTSYVDERRGKSRKGRGKRFRRRLADEKGVGNDGKGNSIDNKSLRWAM
jgi:hypothetical protein